ncbi:hypothetical protein Tco_1097037 [Tanacetum coccineum]
MLIHASPDHIPASPDHVFAFPNNEEDLEMDIDEDPEIATPLIVALPVRSPPLSPPPLSEASSDSDTPAAATAERVLWIPLTLRRFQQERDQFCSKFEIGGPLSAATVPPHLVEHELRSLRRDIEALHGSFRALTRGIETHWTEIATA